MCSLKTNWFVGSGQLRISQMQYAGILCSPRPLDGLRSVDVAQLAETETISSGGVHITVHGDDRTGGGHFKRLAHLNVHLEVSDGAPVIRSCRRPAGRLDEINFTEDILQKVKSRL